MIQQLVIQSKEKHTLHSLMLYIRSTFFIQAEERLHTTTLEVFLMEKDIPKLIQKLYERKLSEEIIFYRKWFSLSKPPISSSEQSHSEIRIDYLIQGSFNEGYYDHFNECWSVKNPNKSSVFYKPEYMELAPQDNIFWAPKI